MATQPFLISDGILRGYNGANGDVIVPSGVTRIGEGAFKNRRALTSVILPNTVTAVDDYAFAGCPDLLSVTLSERLTDVGEGAFFACRKLAAITLPNSLRRIGPKAFKECLSLRSIAIPEGVKRVEKNTFRDCKALTSVELPASLTSLGRKAFCGCLSLPRITIPVGVTSLEPMVIAECPNLTSVTVEKGNPVYHDEGNCVIDTARRAVVCGCRESVIPKEITEIGDGAFYRCYPLTDVALPDGLNRIGESAFAECNALTTVTFPAGVTTLGKEAFRASALSAVVLSEALTAVPRAAFYGCEQLRSLVLPASVKVVGKQAFYKCKRLSYISFPEGLSLIEEGAFCRCGALAEVTLPDSVKSIGANAFDKCEALTTVRLSDGIRILASETFNDCKALLSVRLPARLRVIKAYAFYGCKRLSAISIPETVVQFEQCAFLSCSSLRVIRGVRPKKASHKAFLACPRVPVWFFEFTSDDLEKGKAVLSYLEDPERAENPAIIAFIKSKKAVLLDLCVRENSPSAFAEMTERFGIRFTLGELDLALERAEGTLSIKALLLNYKHKTYRQSAVERHERIETEKRLGLRKRTAAENLALFELEKVHDGWAVASYRGSDPVVVVPAAIGKKRIVEIRSTFRSRNGLKTVIVSDGVKRLGDRAFSLCDELVSVTLPVSVTEIAQTAFSHCPALTEIVYLGTKAQWAAVEKGRGSSGAPILVHCKDGDV
ncbi:MAG: leucine-rich repeat protein [Clostridia bacterium]|nr:leucine-rich repeat protein [Clostridia bacterium]